MRDDLNLQAWLVSPAYIAKCAEIGERKAAGEFIDVIEVCELLEISLEEMPLVVDAAGEYDRQAIALEAARMRRDGLRLGMDLSHGACLERAWRRAKGQRQANMMTAIGNAIRAELHRSA